MSLSPEPWRFQASHRGYRDPDGTYHPSVFSAVLDGQGHVIVVTDTDDDARRIVACVNLCRGFSTEALEQRFVALVYCSENC